MQKVVTGVQVAHMKEAVEGGRKEVSACIGKKGIEETTFQWSKVVREAISPTH